MDVKGKNVFLSGPMSGLDHFNVGEFAKANAIVKEAGAVKVYDPAIEYLNGDKRRGHEWWMRRRIGELTKFGKSIVIPDMMYPFYEVLVSLPGWEDSEGARLEREVALACGMEVVSL